LLNFANRVVLLIFVKEKFDTMKKHIKKEKTKKPHNQFDRVMKDIFAPIVEPFAKSILGLEFQTEEHLPEKLQLVEERETDFGILASNSKGENEIYHFEFQVVDTIEIQLRELVYYSLYRYKHKLNVNQFMIYLGEAPPQYINKPLPIIYNDPLTGEKNCNNLHFYTVIYLKGISYKKLLESNQWQLVVLSILGNYEGLTVDEITDDVLKRLQNIAKDKTELRKAILRIRILSNLRPEIFNVILQKTKAMIGFKIDVTKDPWYKEGHEIGVLEGIEKGIEKGEKYKAVKTAIKLINKKMSVAEIQEITELTDDEMGIVKAYYERFGTNIFDHISITDKGIKVL